MKKRTFVCNLLGDGAFGVHDTKDRKSIEIMERPDFLAWLNKTFAGSDPNVVKLSITVTESV